MRSWWRCALVALARATNQHCSPEKARAVRTLVDNVVAWKISYACFVFQFSRCHVCGRNSERPPRNTKHGGSRRSVRGTKRPPFSLPIRRHGSVLHASARRPRPPASLCGSRRCRRVRRWGRSCLGVLCVANQCRRCTPLDPLPSGRRVADAGRHPPPGPKPATARPASPAS